MMSRTSLLMTATVLAGLLVMSVPAGPTYVGSSACMGCHASTHTSWMSTLHSSMYREPDPGILLPPTWSGVASVEDTGRGLGPLYVELTQSGAASPDQDFLVTMYSDAGLTQLIAGPMTVVRFHGGTVNPENANNDPRSTAYSTRGLRRSGEHYPGEGAVLGKQRFQVMIGDSHYILPIQYNPISDIDGNNQGWVEYHLRDWIDVGFNLVLEASDSEERRCAGCHQTGVVDVTFEASTLGLVPGSVSYEIMGAFQIVGNPAVEENITCEACHGPASDHTMGGFTGDPGSREIIQPALHLNRQQRADMCGFCHSRGSSLGMVNATALGYPYRDAAPNRPLPGDVWGDFYNEGGGYWIDEPGLRVASRHHQQYEEFVLSAHFTNPFVEMTCGTCHDSHGTANEHDLVTTVHNSASGERVVTTARGVSPESLCVECHRTHGPIVSFDLVDMERHYWHPPDGTHGSPDCTNCHMPATATSGVKYDIHSHAFHVLTPEVTLNAQLPNSCMVMCHTGPYSTSYIPGGGPVNTAITDWTEPVDATISSWLLEVMPSSTQVVNYLIASPEELVHLVDEEPYMAPAMDANADTETTTGTDASPFVINAADVVTFVNHNR